MPAQGFGPCEGVSAAASSWKSFGALRALPLLLRSIRAFLWLEQLVLYRDYAQERWAETKQRLAHFYAVNERCMARFACLQTSLVSYRPLARLISQPNEQGCTQYAALA